MARRSSELYKHSEDLRPILSQIRDLKRAYEAAARGDVDAAGEIVGDIIAYLLDDAVSAILDDVLRPGYQLRAAPPSYDKVPRRLLAIEEKLGGSFGFSAKQVRRYIRTAYENTSPLGTKYTISSCRRLAELVRLIHDRVTVEFKAKPMGRLALVFRQHPAAKEAERFVFSIGVLVADAGKESAFPLSYFVATSAFIEVATR